MADGEALAFEQMLVHNLKAPLTGMLASLEMLYDGDLGELSDAQRSAVNAIQAQGAELSRLIDELLDLGRAESSGFSVRAVPVDPTAFLADIREEWRGRLPRLTSDSTVDVSDALADPGVLRRVFDNLLLNVMVHAGADVAVTMRAERAGDVVRLTVADEGPGVPAADAARIFDPFVTLGGTGAVRTHGLGLAYCRAALAAMDGSIRLVPRERGAAFVMDLPAVVVLTRQAMEQDQ